MKLLSALAAAPVLMLLSLQQGLVRRIARRRMPR